MDEFLAKPNAKPEPRRNKLNSLFKVFCGALFVLGTEFVLYILMRREFEEYVLRTVRCEMDRDQRLLLTVDDRLITRLKRDAEIPTTNMHPNTVKRSTQPPSGPPFPPGPPGSIEPVNCTLSTFPSGSINYSCLAGVPGFKGERGLKGEPGFDGVPGLPGFDGSKGESGAPGWPGLQGPPGRDGNQASQGLKGDRGWPGPEGPKGAKGRDGDQGVKGDRGWPGPEGPRGRDGDQGSQRLKGDRGFPGPEGPRGREGSQGQKGQKGERGTSGKDGCQTYLSIGNTSSTNYKIDRSPNGAFSLDFAVLGQPPFYILLTDNGRPKNSAVSKISFNKANIALHLHKNFPYDSPKIPVSKPHFASGSSFRSYVMNVWNGNNFDIKLDGKSIIRWTDGKTIRYNFKYLSFGSLNNILITYGCKGNPLRE